MFKALIVGVMLCISLSVSAEARHYHRHYRAVQHYRVPVDHFPGRNYPDTQGTPTEVVSHPAGCPRSLFCGCGVAVHIFGSPIRDLWLAANWFRYPRATPAPGMVAVRNHHVFAIERVLGNGLVVAYDPNSGRGLTRVHERSLAGYTVVDPHGAPHARVAGLPHRRAL